MFDGKCFILSPSSTMNEKPRAQEESYPPALARALLHDQLDAFERGTKIIAPTDLRESIQRLFLGNFLDVGLESLSLEYERRRRILHEFWKAKKSKKEKLDERKNALFYGVIKGERKPLKGGGNSKELFWRIAG